MVDCQAVTDVTYTLPYFLLSDFSLKYRLLSVHLVDVAANTAWLLGRRIAFVYQ